MFKIKFTLLFTLLFLSKLAFAEIVVVVNKSNTSEISQKDIKKLFMGMSKTYGDGKNATPVNVKDNDTLRENFNRQFLGKNSIQVNAYWARLAFSGRSYDLKEIPVSEIISAVASDAAAIAYIDSAQVSDKVRVLSF